MKAVVVSEQDKSVTWGEADTPKAGPGEVLIRVHASAINRADLSQRQGGYPPPPGASPILGLECAGEITAVGEGVSRWRVGDSVCALIAGGGYAEFAVAPEGSVVSIPDGLSYVEAASLPEVFATAWINLFMEAGLAAGEKVILHAGASGVGTAAIQLCKNFGNPCFVTAGSNDKIKACLDLGADAGGNRHEGSFFDKAKAFAGEQGVDVILDPVGGAYFEDNLRLLALNGRLVLIGLMGGRSAQIDLGRLLIKRARVIGSTLRGRANEEKAQVMAALEEKVWPLIETKTIKPIIDTTYDIADIEAAHSRVASDQTIGKVVLVVRP